MSTNKHESNRWSILRVQYIIMNEKKIIKQFRRNVFVTIIFILLLLLYLSKVIFNLFSSGLFVCFVFFNYICLYIWIACTKVSCIEWSLLNWKTILYDSLDSKPSSGCNRYNTVSISPLTTYVIPCQKKNQLQDRQWKVDHPLRKLMASW